MVLLGNPCGLCLASLTSGVLAQSAKANHSAKAAADKAKASHIAKPHRIAIQVDQNDPAVMKPRLTMRPM